MIELNKIHNMDCLEYMKTVPDKYFDLVLTDPPYGLGDRLSDGGGKLKNSKITIQWYEHEFMPANTSAYAGDEIIKKMAKIRKIDVNL